VSGSGALLIAQALAVAALVALVLALWIVFRRAGRLVAETRRRESFRRTTEDLALRIDRSLEGVTARIDGVRRRTLAADAIGDSLAAASEAMERYAEEARELATGPAGAREIRDAIVAELERAGRAIELTRHGCTILSAARVGGRELEAQTAVKRGYLNLLHAREAIARHAATAAELAGDEAIRTIQRGSA
jgi:hypothetical protein